MHSAQVLAPTQSVAKENVFMIQKVDVKKKKTTSKTIIITLLVRLQNRRPKQKDSEIIFPVLLEMKKIYIYHYTHFSWDEEQWQCY